MDASDTSTILQTFALHLEQGDADAAAAVFALDTVYEEPPAFRFVGREALRSFFRDFLDQHSEVHFIIGRTFSAPGGTPLAAEWRWSYTRDADGEQRAFQGMCVVDLQDGLIACWRGYSARVDA